MSRSRKTLAGLSGLILLGAALIARVSCHQTNDPQDLVITTGGKGGTYIKLGELLKPILEHSGGPIGEVTSVRSEGSLENIGRLQYAGDTPCRATREQQNPNAPELDESRKPTACRADLAFVAAPAVFDHGNEVQVLMTLYDDVLQVVTCTLPENIRKLKDLEGRGPYSIFLDQEKSVTRSIAKRILDDAGIKFVGKSAKDYRDASDKVVSGEFDLAFFLAGTPVEAVSSAMDTGDCRLLSVEGGKDVTDDSVDELGIETPTIPRFLYQNQSGPVETLRARALLVARQGLSPEIVQAVLNALFDHVDELAVANIRANEIRLWKAFDLPDERLKLHPGAKKFKAIEKHTLLISTGSLGGKYYNQGQMIQLLLQKRRIRTSFNVMAAGWEQARTDFSVIPQLFLDWDRAHARVIHTNGSLENAELLERPDDQHDPRPTLAIMQYDVALASRLEKSSIYRTELPGVKFPDLPDLQRIATLGTETLYVIAQRDLVTRKQVLARGLNEEDVGTVRSLKGLSVCLGPEQSGTRAIAEAVLEHHEILDDISPSYLMVPDMVHRLHTGEIHAGFIVSGLPSHTVETLLDDPQLRLLSLGARERAKIVESAPFGSVSIPPDTYAAQLKDEAIRTIATRAVLVTNADLPFDVETITEAIFEGAAFLGIGGSALEVTAPSITTGEDTQKRLLRFMAQDLPSLPLHPGAKAYYERVGLLPHDPGFVDLFYDWLTATWRGLAVLLILVTGYIGFISLTRDRTSNRIGREIFKIVLDDGDSSPVSQLKRLAKKRAVINELVPQRYFQEDLDKPRWRELNDLIEYWMGVAKDNLTRDLADEIGSDSSDESLIDKQRLDRGKDLSQRVRKHFEDDELEASQYEMLTKLIQQELPEGAASEVR